METVSSKMFHSLWMNNDLIGECY